MALGMCESGVGKLDGVGQLGGARALGEIKSWNRKEI